MPNLQFNNYNNLDNRVFDSQYINDLLSKKQKDDNKNISKEVNKQIDKELNFDQISIKKLYYNLINTVQLIINDLIKLFSSPVPKHQDFIQLLRYYFQNIFKILTYKERIFYLGIVLVIISFLAYFILVSS